MLRTKTARIGTTLKARPGGTDKILVSKIKLGLLLMLPFMTACGVQASLNELNPSQSVFMRESFSNVAVTSQQAAETVENQYKVQVSSGAITNRIADRTANGTLVMTSTQGALLDDVTVRDLQYNLSVPAQ